MTDPARCVRAPRALALVVTSLATIVSPSRADVALPPGFGDHVVVSGLDQPTAFAFLPDGRAVVTEQLTGAIRLVIGGSLSPTPLATVSGLTTDGGERGLLAIAIDPGWPARPYVYVHATVTGSKMRLIRYTATGTLTGATSFDLALGSPYLVLDGLADLASNHNGGALRFGTDGRLYYSLGDDADGCQAQDSTTLHGAVLRLDLSGLPAGAGGPPARTALVPADNPWSGGANVNARLEWAYGLRNPFRFVVDSASGLLYLSDVGENTWEELDEITSGFNGGWPFREGPAIYTGASCSEPGGVGTGAYDPPIDSYDHGEGVVIIAAAVIRPVSPPRGRPPGTATCSMPTTTAASCG
jgi:glucose/arabinose dehydrogenase